MAQRPSGGGWETAPYPLEVPVGNVWFAGRILLIPLGVTIRARCMVESKKRNCGGCAWLTRFMQSTPGVGTTGGHVVDSNDQYIVRVTMETNLRAESSQ